MRLINIKVLKGTLSAEKKKEMISRVTETEAEIEARPQPKERLQLHTWCRGPEKIQAQGSMKFVTALCCFIVSIGLVQIALAQSSQKVFDIPTRPGVTQRFVYLAPENPIASVILFAGGHGGLQISQNGSFKWGETIFLVRTRELFAKNGLSVAVVDAPSDRQSAPFLSGFRQTGGHVADIKAVIAWLKQKANVPVWLVGTSMGTLSAAFIATRVGPSDGGSDGLVLTSTVLSLDRGRPVPAMPLHNITTPVLVVHHEHDGCKSCAYAQIPGLMEKLTSTPKKELLTFKGGITRGDPCGPLAYHGFNGLENEVVARIAEWIRVK
jgi:dienelactone hydrolase